MKKMYILVCLVGWLLCSPVVSLGYGASYDNGGLVETLKTNAETKAFADEIKTDMKDAQTIDQSETRRKMWKAYIDNMPTPKDVDWYGYNYMPETYEEKFIPNIVGLIGVGLLFFLVLLSLVWKRNKHTRNSKQKENEKRTYSRERN